MNRIPRSSPYVWIENGHRAVQLSDLVTLSDFADAAGVANSTVSGYLARGKMPEPVARINGSPVWRRDDMRFWLRKRPGQGYRSDLVGGGR